MEPEADIAPPPTLAQRLRAETRLLHTAAERSALMGTLLRGKLAPRAYAALLYNLRAVYQALEPALERHASNPAVAAVHQPALARTAALTADLAALLDAVDAAPELQPACLAYVQRLEELDAHHPELLVAHAYVRYLGDLSGGQLLCGIVERSMALPPGRGTAFYRFGTPAQARALTQAFRVGLDRIELDAGGCDALVAEATQSYAWHCGLFEELADAYALDAPRRHPPNGSGP